MPVIIRVKTAYAPEREAFLCTGADPFTREKWAKGRGRVEHVDIENIGECPEGCCDHLRCRNCGVDWYSELPQ